MHSKITQYIAFISYLIPVLSLKKKNNDIWYDSRIRFFSYFFFPHLISRETLFPLPLRKENMHRLRIVCHIIEVQVYNCSNEPAFRARETVCNFSPWDAVRKPSLENELNARGNAIRQIFTETDKRTIYIPAPHTSRKSSSRRYRIRSPPALPPRW